MRALLITLLLGLPLHEVLAQSAEEKGLAIAEEMERRDTGWGGSEAKMTMLLRNRQGQETTRKIRARALEVTGDGDKSMSIFDTPRDVKGTAFLSHTHSTKPDDQWLYLPALKRVKRISSSNKSGPFMGSEFAYEDLTSQEVDKYSYKWLRDENQDGKNIAVMERYPEYKHSGYTRQVVWVDLEIYQATKIEFYDRKNALLKTLDMSNHKQYLDKYWRPLSMDMVNHQTGKSTSLSWTDYNFGDKFSDSDFTRNSLKRAR
jgi:outer membrane lipoprotein-sorting protein